jgi:hypothetical protein
MKFMIPALLVASATGFVPLHSGVRSSTLQSINSVPGGWDPMGAAGPPLPVAEDVDPVDITLANMFPTDIPMRKMQGGGTVRTWDIPPEAERLYYYIRTNGRPLKAMVELVSVCFFFVDVLVWFREGKNRKGS